MTGIEPGADRVAVENGTFVVPADMIATAFDLDPGDVPAMMRAGRITSRCERGIAGDEGRWRLTLYHGNRALRLTVDESGAILKRAQFDTARARVGR